MANRTRSAFLGLASVFIIASSITGHTLAADAANGIAVSPGQLAVSFAASDTQQTVPLTLSNNYASPVELNATFQGIDEQAGLLIPTTALDPTFASTLHISQTDIHIAARSSVTVFVQAVNAANLSPGGHYATLILTQLGTGAQQLSLQASISLSLFVVKQQGAREQLEATDLHTNGWLFGRPTAASITFSNAGNVHVVPRAVVSILRGNTVLASGVANQTSFPLLPGTRLTNKVDLKVLGRMLLPGTIRVNAQYRADGDTDTKTISRSALYIPPFYPLFLLAILGLCLRRLFKKRPGHAFNAIHIPEIIRPVQTADGPSAAELKADADINIPEETRSTAPERVKIMVRTSDPALEAPIVKPLKKPKKRAAKPKKTAVKSVKPAAQKSATKTKQTKK